MKITNSEVIRTGEKELIDAITGDLDWQAIEQLFREKYHLGLQDEVEYKKGDMVVHNNQIAYKLDFEVKVTLSVLFDRRGECLEVTALDRHADMDAETQSRESDLDIIVPDEPANENVSQMASQIAEMMTEINKD